MWRKADEGKALQIADAVTQRLISMSPGERLLAKLSVTKEPKKLAVFSPGMNPDDIDPNELYSTTYEWLQTFAKFCRASCGFKVM
jgi:hypothetical protein